MQIIGHVQILDHDIHYGYEGGYYVNFTVDSDKAITYEEVTNKLYKHFNPKPIEQLKKEWKPFMPTNPFNLDLVYDEHTKSTTREISLTI